MNTFPIGNKSDKDKGLITQEASFINWIFYKTFAITHFNAIDSIAFAEQSNSGI